VGGASAGSPGHDRFVDDVSAAFTKRTHELGVQLVTDEEDVDLSIDVILRCVIRVGRAKRLT